MNDMHDIPNDDDDDDKTVAEEAERDIWSNLSDQPWNWY